MMSRMNELDGGEDVEGDGLCSRTSKPETMPITLVLDQGLECISVKYCAFKVIHARNSVMGSDKGLGQPYN